MEEDFLAKKQARRKRRNLVAKHSKHRSSFHRTPKEYKRKPKHDYLFTGHVKEYLDNG